MTRSRDTADQINRINSSAANATAITVDSSENVSLTGALDVTGTATANKVTIGTSSASNGKLTLEGVDGGNSAGIYFNNTTATNGKSYSLSSGNSGEFMLYDRTSNAYRLVVDTSGNLLVGKTSLDGTGSRGIELRPDGLVLASKSNSQPMSLDRNGTDGDILWLGKNGSKVGSIGVASGEFYHGSAVGGDTFLRSGYSTIVPATSAGANRDNAINLGSSVSRFKDLYLSGGVYLGGTGAANYLEDYEEGVFTVSLALGSGSAALTQDKLFYTKVGRCVTVSGIIRVDSVSSPSGTLAFNVPFACQAPGTGEDNPRATVQTNLVDSGNNNEVILEMLEGAVVVNLYKSGTASLGGAGDILRANTTLGINFLYFT